jgi:small subunit ribosomal protein S3
MGQKIHPLGFRLGITQKHKSDWVANAQYKPRPHLYPQFLLEDRVLRKTILERYPNAEISDIFIERFEIEPTVFKITIRALYPRNILKQNPEELTVLRSNLKKALWRSQQPNSFISSASLRNGRSSNFSSSPSATSSLRNKKKIYSIDLIIKRCFHPFSEAFFITRDLVQNLEARKPFRPTVKKLMDEVEKERKKNKKVQKERKKNSYGEQPIQGFKIQLSGRLNGAEIARTETFRYGRVPLQTLKANIDYSYQRAQTKYGIIGIKVWVLKGTKTIANVLPH